MSDAPRSAVLIGSILEGADGRASEIPGLKIGARAIFYLISPEDLNDVRLKLTLSRLKRLDIPLLAILNKVDVIPGIEFGRIISNINQELDCRPVFISAENNFNLHLLGKYIKRHLITAYE